MRRPGAWATGLVLVFALFLSDNLLRTPVQRSDSLELILDALRSPSATAAFSAAVGAPGYMRPLFRAENKLLFEVGGVSSLQWAYRGFHACLLSIGWGAGLLSKTPWIDAGADEYRQVLRHVAAFRRAIESGMPFPKTRRIVFEQNRPASLPGWALLEAD